MSNSSKQRYHRGPITLATVLAALDHAGKLSATRKRDLRSTVTRVADLLGDEPAAIVLDLPAISSASTRSTRSRLVSRLNASPIFEPISWRRPGSAARSRLLTAAA